ncbi:hypothetical protein KFL_005270010 [Klebsormidium nitens]|uniref:Uncharacterized protein n=1 Tax=Klebsormidium nitens TaxID=105231 RepID=A0A1Y1IJ54_KLENI|nr:hypothetical protein KFL_005270010 [Klebsormidium nitens]|eukprot:GAQ89469.1 hypothetical protein KFL_005270010 [Klebsormidium nitens]
MFASATCAVTIPKRKRSSSCARNQLAPALKLQKDSVKRQRIYQKGCAGAVSRIASRFDFLPAQPYGLAADDAATDVAKSMHCLEPDPTKPGGLTPEEEFFKEVNTDLPELSEDCGSDGPDSDNLPTGDDACPDSEADSGSPQAPLPHSWEFELTEQEFWEGPSYMDVESITQEMQTALVVSVPMVLSTKLDNVAALDCSKLELDYNIPFELAAPTDGHNSEDHPTDDDFIAQVLFAPKTANDEVLLREILAICDQADNLTSDGTHMIGCRPTTRMSSCDFARARPWDIQVVAEELAKGIPNADTKKSWCFAIHGWNRNDLNRDFLKRLQKKIWVNTSKNKEDREPSPLNDCMDVQNQGFRAHLLPNEEVPVYLQSQGNFKPMLRFSMRVYTRKETSANGRSQDQVGPIPALIILAP